MARTHHGQATAHDSASKTHGPVVRRRLGRRCRWATRRRRAHRSRCLRLVDVVMRLTPSYYKHERLKHKTVSLRRSRARVGVACLRALDADRHTVHQADVEADPAGREGRRDRQRWPSVDSQTLVSLWRPWMAAYSSHSTTCKPHRSSTREREAPRRARGRAARAAGWAAAYGALDAAEWKSDGRMPSLGRLLDEIVDGLRTMG